jgi:translation initiation factor 3 subunit D
MVFSVPNVVDNEEGWGPCTVPEQYKDIPYAPFSKSDKLGKASDWMNSGYSKFNNRYGVRDSGIATVFNFFANEEEDSFHLVDNRAISRPKFGRRFQQRGPNFRRNQELVGRDSGGGADRERARRERQQAKKSQWNFWHNNRNRDNVQYSSSVDIRPEWSVLEQIQLTSLTKLSFDVKAAPNDISKAGQLEYYDKSYDRIGAKQEVNLKRYTKRTFHQVSTTSDPVLQKLAKNAKDDVSIFATDQILSTLMCSPRSVYSWDILVTREGKKLFLDKRDRSKFDLLTVHETAQDMIPDEKDNINGVPQLSLEATTINQNFSQQVLVPNGQKYDFGEPNPFASKQDDVAPVAYRYRSWSLQEGMTLYARCELHAALEYKGEQQLCTVKALNEFDSKVTGIDWRQKLENQRGAVIATELKNNANKLAKWTAQALLAGADQMKIGYVTRVHPRDNRNHVILGTQFYKPKDFAQQINLNVNNMWGILKSVVDICINLEDGKFLLVKDPNKPLIRLYEVPQDAFDEDEFEDEVMDQMEEALPEVAGKKEEDV